MSAKPERLISLDVMRGLVVVGMIVVNSAAYVKALDGFDAYPLLLHAEWAGFTLADFVFPAFIFMVGVSIAIALRHVARLDAAMLRVIAWRAVRLFLAGLFVSNLYWAANWSENAFRVMGVLQRIGLCYFATSVLFLTVSPRTRMIVAIAILLLYWPLCLLPMPDGHATDIHVAGANFISWFDRAVLGPTNFEKGPFGFDPEGLLSTLPAIAQCLIGAAVGEWLLKNVKAETAPRDLALAGVALALVGFGWSFAFPFIKALWTSSYVLYSTGLSSTIPAGAVLLAVRPQAMAAAYSRLFSPLSASMRSSPISCTNWRR